MPYIVHRDELQPLKKSNAGWDRFDLVGPINARIMGATYELGVLSPGFSTTLHYHVDGENYIYIIHGAGKLVVEGEAFPVEADYSIDIEKGEKHLIRNDGEGPLEFLEFLIPENTKTVILNEDGS
jgi:mannose-6-phosphate isomerase-like protein (cupin superfamily)